MAALVGLLSEKPAGARIDADIRKQILDEIDQQRWERRHNVDTIVTNGVVVLKGTITDERERAALRVAAENVPGVAAVSRPPGLGRTRPHHCYSVTVSPWRRR
jgi:osmotically-inducible protein OsmY